MFSKKFGQFKQWTAEKLGNSTKSEPSEEYKKLEIGTEDRKETNEKINHSLHRYMSVLGKKKVSALVQTMALPISSLAQAMTAHGRLLGDDSKYGASLVEFGTSAEKIGTEQLELLSKLTASYKSYHDSLGSFYKEHTNLKKKLKKRRLDYDARLNKMQKAKKDMPKDEEELKRAQAKYETTLSDTFMNMRMILENEENMMQPLSAFTHALYDYFKKSTECIEPLIAVFDNRIKEIGCVPFAPGATPVCSYVNNKLSSMSLEKNGEESAGTRPDMQGNVKKFPGDVNDKIGAFRAAKNAHSVEKDRIFRVCVLYDFAPETSDDLALVKGAVVNVLEKVDDGWWIGECAGSIGMFPSNYVCVLDDVADKKSKMMGEVAGAVANGAACVKKECNPACQSSELKKSAGSQCGLKKPSVFESNLAIECGAECAECGCRDFSANAFVSGKCNNCFHRH